MNNISYEVAHSKSVSVGTTRVRLTGGIVRGIRHGAVIQNLGPDILYVGGETVTTSNGIRVAANEKLSVDGPVDMYGVSILTSDTRVLELE